jgi:hypothetical protein
MASLPLVELPPGATIALEAVDPVSGSPVGGVVLTAIAISPDVGAEPPPQPPPPLPPLLAHAPVGSEAPGAGPGG